MARFALVTLCSQVAGFFLLAATVVLCADDLPQNAAHRRFRIDNRLIAGDKVTKSVTIFYDGLVYDCIGDYGQITIYDKAAGTLTLLDPSCRLKAVVTTGMLAEDFERCRGVFRKSDNAFQNYLADPFFEENAYETESGLLYFRSPWVEYRFETVTLDDPVVSEAYYDFCRQFTLLNIRTSGSPTPMIRNELNPVLEQNQRFPGKVGMTLYPRGKVIISSRAIHAESTHTFVRRLQPPDEERVEQANRYRRQFHEVSLDDYLREGRK
ncbi:MAG: hypothetical protein FWH27_04605 [Planctomycetaceae bacterium]|nr:hypothetical protein [Planctomycetaceae bacterium]